MAATEKDRRKGVDALASLTTCVRSIFRDLVRNVIEVREMGLDWGVFTSDAVEDRLRELWSELGVAATTESKQQHGQ